MSVRYPDNVLSFYSEILRKAYKLAVSLANDWQKAQDNEDDVEWVSNIINVSVDSYAENDDGSEDKSRVYLDMSVDGHQLNVWYDYSEKQIDYEHLYYLYCDGHLGDTLEEWVEAVESKINDVEGRVLEIYRNEKLLPPGDERFYKGTFRNMIYLCPDMELTDNLSDEEAGKVFRGHFEAIEDVVVAMLNDDEISDFRLVLTPLVCDEEKSHGYKPPKKQDNYIVTPLNEGDLDLIEKVIIPSGKYNDGIAAYVVVELNDNAPEFNDEIEQGVDSYDHRIRMASLALQLGNYVASEKKLPVKMYLDIPDEGFVEQTCDANVGEKTNDFLLADGFAKAWINDDKLVEYRKYRLFDGEEFFDGEDYRGYTGQGLVPYRLSKEELKKYSEEFKKLEWVYLDNMDE